MHVVLPKRSSGEWRLRQNDSLNERTPGTLDPGRGTLKSCNTPPAMTLQATREHCLIPLAMTLQATRESCLFPPAITLPATRWRHLDLLLIKLMCSTCILPYLSLAVSLSCVQS